MDRRRLGRSLSNPRWPPPIPRRCPAPFSGHPRRSRLRPRYIHSAEERIVKYRNLGDTDLRLSEVGFGVWTLTTGWWGQHDEADVIRLLRLGADLGITLFDNADVYGDGDAEILMGKALKPVRD